MTRVVITKTGNDIIDIVADDDVEILFLDSNLVGVKEDEIVIPASGEPVAPLRYFRDGRPDEVDGIYENYHISDEYEGTNW